MKNCKKISKKVLAEMLLNWNLGAQPASIEYVSQPKLTKEGKEKFGSLIKVAYAGVMLGYIYENAVNNEREREGLTRDFISQPLWNGKGKRLSSCLAKHVEKNELYLSYKYQQSFGCVYLDEKLNIVPKDVAENYMVKSFPKNQGVENPVYHRELNINNIKRIKIKKISYEII